MIPINLIRQAHREISPFIHRTPLVRSQALSTRWGANVYLKLENFQKTGSFKPRGAFFKLLNLSDEERSCGVVGVSGGNHAQGLAFAARTLGISATICMPATTPKNYLEATAGYGASIRLSDTIHAAFQDAAHLQSQGQTLIHPFDDESLAAGQGTVGLEILEELPNVSRCYVSIGGGGLIAGIASALRARIDSFEKGTNQLYPKVIGVETVGADAMAQAVAANQIVPLPAITSIARTLGAPAVSKFTLEAVQELVEEVLVVSDQESIHELFFLLERCKVLAEPAAACCLAAANRQSASFRKDENIVIVICGGNASIADLAEWFAKFGR
jgi:threonine dehydratase